MRTGGGGGMCCVSMPWIVLGTLVVINNDEGDHWQAISTHSTPFDAPLELCSAHGAHAREGRVTGSTMGPKVVNNEFFQSCS